METALIIALALLVVLLAAMLAIRIRSERRQNSVLHRLSLTEYSDLIRASILDNSIQEVAGAVSDMLKHACSCERILFLRKRRMLLELNYFHGVQRFNRRDLRLRYSDMLVAHLQGRLLPEPLTGLKPLLPTPLLQKLEEWNFDVYFPIFWRDHLYGLYFISSTAETRSHAFKVVIASLAQALSAAYHVRWQEERLNRLSSQLENLEAAGRATRPGDGSFSPGVLKLIRHRDSETIVARIMDEVHRDLGLDRFAFVYPSKRPEEPLLVLKRGVEGELSAPLRKVMGDLTAKLTNQPYEAVSELAAQGPEMTSLGDDLRRAGLKYLTAVELSAGRTGLLAWDDEQPPEWVISGLQRHRGCVRELVENAESFEQIEEMSYTDALTGLANQRYFFKRLTEEIGRAKRYQRTLALIIFDLDDLKGVNDSYGHLAGDAVLRQMGEILRSSIRGIDVVARYGGDEFCVIMPESDRKTCLQFMQRLQRKMANQKIKLDQLELDIQCTISLGGAVYPEHGSTSEQLIYSADMALLKAKEGGRNQCRIY